MGSKSVRQEEEKISRICLGKGKLLYETTVTVAWGVSCFER